jgi:hypothetical protein
MPSLDLGGPGDVGRGRWLPTSSVDQYSATLANWFGVGATNLPTVLPNLGRFAVPDLGFLGQAGFSAVPRSCACTKRASARPLRTHPRNALVVCEAAAVVASLMPYRAEIRRPSGI